MSSHQQERRGRLLTYSLILFLVPLAVSAAAATKRARMVKRTYHKKYVSRLRRPVRRVALRRTAKRRIVKRRLVARRKYYRHAVVRRRVVRRWHTPGSEISPSRAQKIQEALIQAGDLHEQPTGRWDAQTRDAMRVYQRQNGFQATGLPEAKSLMKMGLGPHPLPPQLDPMAQQAQAGNHPTVDDTHQRF